MSLQETSNIISLRTLRELITSNSVYNQDKTTFIQHRFIFNETDSMPEAFLSLSFGGVLGSVSEILVLGDDISRGLVKELTKLDREYGRFGLDSLETLGDKLRMETAIIHLIDRGSTRRKSGTTTGWVL